MKKTACFLFVLTVLLASTLACSFGGGQVHPAATEVVLAAADTAVTEAPTPTKVASEPTQPKIETEFPLLEDAFEMMDLGNGMISFKTRMKQADIIAFYRDEFTKSGYTEREITTTITDSLFSMVFDGHANGKAIVIQAVDLGDGTTNVSLRFE